MNTRSNKWKKKFIYSEEFKIEKSDFSTKELKQIFNQKYFNYIKRVENRYWENNN